MNKRFGFGNNWKKYLKTMNLNRITDAENSLISMLDLKTLKEQTFLDIGSGSGLFSLAAVNLGAKVTSFDYDMNSVDCNLALKKKYLPKNTSWQIDHGSILNVEFLKSLEKYDIVYSWGVLHHTGSMWKAIENASSLVANNGLFYIAIYNDQLIISIYWKLVKKLYNMNFILKYIIILIHFPYFILLRRIIRGVTLRKLERGMNLWYDMLDWLGGYPFEVSKPSEIVKELEAKNFILKKQVLVGNRQGCNEFIFQKV